jgi:hypothetical protein
VRFAALVLLAGCSALIPPRLWHPSGWEAEEGELGCPSYAYPVVDLGFGVPMLTLGVTGAVVATEPTSPSGGIGEAVNKALATEAAIIGLVTGVVWTASGIYGLSNEQSCHRELRDQLRAR